MKKLFVVIVLLCLLLPSAVFANDPYPKDGGATCRSVWASITNNTEETLKWGRGYIKANGVTVFSLWMDDFAPGVAPGETTTVSWNPPAGFVGDVEAFVKVRPRAGRIDHTVIGELDCYEVCDQRIVDRIKVVEGEWSAWEWDVGLQHYVRTRSIKTVTIYVDARDKKTECPPRDRVFTTEEQTRGPDQVIVGVSLRCSTPDEDGTCWQLMGGVTVEPTDGAILTLDGVDYTASQGLHADFGTHEWSAVANESFTILGDDHGTIKITESECNVPFAHLPTGPSGQPINLPLVILIGLIGVSALSAGAFVVKRSRQ